FLPGQPWPNYSYQVPRADFDAVLLDHATKRGVTVYQPATVEGTEFDAGGVTVTASAEDRPLRARAAMLVDATGRDALMASRYGRRRRIPNLGKVALFAHFKGAARRSGLEEGNIRVYVFRDGWFWWIPLAGDVTSVGAICHAIAFVDPIFSGGVYIALRSGQLASVAIRDAFRAGDFSARRFADYERRVRAGLDPLFKFIHKYYEPSFFDLLMRPRNHFGIYEAVLNVLSGGNWVTMPWRVRAALRILYGIARINAWVRRRAGLPVESRLEW